MTKTQVAEARETALPHVTVTGHPDKWAKRKASQGHEVSVCTRNGNPRSQAEMNNSKSTQSQQAGAPRLEGHWVASQWEDSRKLLLVSQDQPGHSLAVQSACPAVSRAPACTQAREAEIRASIRFSVKTHLS